jgi:hypothetical protein
MLRQRISSEAIEVVDDIVGVAWVGNYDFDLPDLEEPVIRLADIPGQAGFWICGVVAILVATEVQVVRVVVPRGRIGDVPCVRIVVYCAFDPAEVVERVSPPTGIAVVAAADLREPRGALGCRRGSQGN